MTDLVVIRGDGDRPGPDVVDGLLSSPAVALARGTIELDEGQPADEVSLTASFLDVRPGDSVRVLDPALGVWTGKVTGVAHSATIDDHGGISLDTVLTVRKPRAAP